MNVNKEINKIKQANYSPNNNADAVINIFRQVLGDEQIDNKEQELNNIYDNILPPEFSKKFISRSVNLIQEFKGDYLDWFLKRFSNSPEDIIALTYKIQNPTVILDILDKKLFHLSQESFNEKIIKPYYIDCPSQINNPLKVYLYYCDKYKVNILSEISGYRPSIQEKLIKGLIRCKYFKSHQLYEELESHIKKLGIKNKKEIYGYIFKFEKNLNLFKIFEDKYMNMLVSNSFDVNHLSLAVVDRVKRDYIIDNYLLPSIPNYYEHFNRAIDCSLVREGQTTRDESAFYTFINRLVSHHIDGTRPLLVDQFCIIAKRCYDFGFMDELKQVFSLLKQNDLEMYKKVNQKIQNFPQIKINQYTTINFDVPALKLKLQELYVSYLTETLEESPTKIKSIKI